MSPTTVGELALVNYWAIGTNCCRPLGSFTCDGSRDPGAGYGVVILKSDTRHFGQAVQKALEGQSLMSLVCRIQLSPRVLSYDLSTRDKVLGG
jgi:hypothetical protein